MEVVKRSFNIPAELQRQSISHTRQRGIRSVGRYAAQSIALLNRLSEAKITARTTLQYIDGSYKSLPSLNIPPESRRRVQLYVELPQEEYATLNEFADQASIRLAERVCRSLRLANYITALISRSSIEADHFTFQQPENDTPIIIPSPYISQR